MDRNCLEQLLAYLRNMTVEKLRCQPGTRFPHLWVNYSGKTISTLDLFSTEYVRLGGPDSFAYGQENFYRLGPDLIPCEKEITWRSLTGLADNQTILVRPDGFIV